MNIKSTEKCLGFEGEEEEEKMIEVIEIVSTSHYDDTSDTDS